VPDHANVLVKVVAIFSVIKRVLATAPAHNIFCYSAVVHVLNHWCGRQVYRGLKLPQKFWFLLAKFFKIQAKFLKTSTNSVIVWAKMAANISWFEKTGAQFSGKIENSSKNLSHPQKYACSYTYALTPSVNLAFRFKLGFKNKSCSWAVFRLVISGSGQVQASKKAFLQLCVGMYARANKGRFRLQEHILHPPTVKIDWNHFAK